jgi:simple sugar transport system permease protein
LHLGVVALVLLPLVVHVGLFRTGAGLLVRAVGDSAATARLAGFSLARVRLAVMAASGALAGLGGALQLCGVTRYLSPQFAAGTGYAAIAVALVGRLSPLGVVVAALFFGALEAGAETMQLRAGVPAALVRVIQAVVIVAALASDRRLLARLRGA